VLEIVGRENAPPEPKGPKDEEEIELLKPAFLHTYTAVLKARSQARSPSLFDQRVCGLAWLRRPAGCTSAARRPCCTNVSTDAQLIRV
jgi:hypothetical protein